MLDLCRLVFGEHAAQLQDLSQPLGPVLAQVQVEGLLDKGGVAPHPTARCERSQRCVLVITGRGALTGGTLRAMTPRWLDEPPNRPRVLAYAAAQRHHGGDGALYVLLRRAS